MCSEFRRFAGVSLVCLFVVACGGGAPAPTPPPPPTAAALPPPAASAEPAPSAAASAAPSASGQAEAPKSSGRPPVFKTGDTEVADTFGSSPAARLEIGGDKDHATLKIPEGALGQATNVVFKIDTKGKTGGGQIGKIYAIIPVVPPNPEAAKVPTSGPPFELQLPAGNKKDANLAVGEIGKDDKGRDKITWTIYAPTKIDDTTGTAYFELPALSYSYLHVTTKAATAAKP